METGRFEVGVYEHGRAVGVASLHEEPLAAIDAAARLSLAPRIAGGTYLAQPAGTAFLDAMAAAVADGRRPADVLHDFDIEFEEMMTHGTAAHAALDAFGHAAAACGVEVMKALTNEVWEQTLAFILRAAPSYLAVRNCCQDSCEREDASR